MFAKVDVNGDDAAPVYKYLKKAKPGLLGCEAIKWNFTKFLVDRKGRWSSATRPTKSRNRIARRHRKGAVQCVRRLGRAGRHRGVRCCSRAWRRPRAEPKPTAKVLRVAFLVAETGFDPQAVSDLYSNYVNRVIFDSLYAYDYLARPYRIVPNTAAAMPDISRRRPDLDDQGQAGHLLRRRSGVQGQEARADRGRLRLFVEARCSTRAALAATCDVFDGKFVGMDALLAKAKETGKLDYDAPVEGLQARRPLHAAHQAQLSLRTICWPT